MIDLSLREIDESLVFIVEKDESKYKKHEKNINLFYEIDSPITNNRRASRTSE